MTDDEIISVVQAHKEGKQLEWKPNWSATEWAILIADPVWDFVRYDYRVKPEPRKLREWTLCDGRGHENWIVVPENHDSQKCGGESVRVREISE